jgi:hypothetical protein
MCHGWSLIPHKAAAVVLRKAAQKVGGMKQLADALGVRTNTLQLYIDGAQPVPEALYLRAVDIVLGDPDKPPPASTTPSRKRPV